MALEVVTLTTETYAQLVREACASLRMPYRLQEEERRRLPETRLHFAGAVAEGGLLVGWGSVQGGASTVTWLRPGHFKLSMLVDEAWRGRGAGGALYRALERFAREHGGAVLEADVGEANAAALAFAERRGFVKDRHLFASKLQLDELDAARFAGAVAAAEAAGIRFTSYAEYAHDEAAVERLRDLMWELHQDVPGFGKTPRPPLELVRSSLMERPGWDPTCVLLAVDTTRGGEWVALAQLSVDGSRSPEAQREGGLWLYNAFTGVRRNYRGRGLAQALKLKAAAYARGRGATAMRTHNDSANAPMLAVNRKLGYRPEPGYYKLRRTL